MHGQNSISMTESSDRLPSGEERDAAFEIWRTQLRTLTRSEADARDWRHRRYRFAHRLGERLVGATEGAAAVTGPAVYGVWLGCGLIYVGQTQDAQRRLRDLPIGESHHLANTFPPEIWDRVVLIAWPKLQAAALVASVPTSVVGLALEHALQRELQPLANASRRRADGTFADVNWATSRSEGARRSAEVGPLFDAVSREWKRAASLATDTVSDAVRVVCPANLL